MLRTHTCNELTEKAVNKSTTLCGWVQSRRDHGGVFFIDLRDRYGLTQIVFDPSHNKEAHKQANSLRREDCIQVTGKVKKRKAGMTNPKLKTGNIEVFIDNLKVINKAETPPIEIEDRVEANEDLRLKYRYLDLRRPKMQKSLEVRHRFITAAREFFNKNNFLEIETPILVKSTPEGARDFVVPSRIHPGKFYALPQSPQLYKQLLMIAGCDRYYQIAKCLRDEDLRADRQPEHSQIDFEMSFVEQEDIRAFVEKLLQHVFNEFKIKVKTPFTALSYKEAMDKYGSDKPDLRYGLELTNITNIVTKSDFGVFKDVASNGGIIKCINPEKDLPRKEIDKYIEFCTQNGAKGMAWMRVTKDGLDSNIAKYFSKDVQKELIKATKAKPDSILMFIADKEKSANAILDKLRRKLAEDLALYDKKEFKFAWINDFPLFAWNEDEERWEPEHHMFSMPKQEFIATMEKDPAPVLGDLWDLTLNGWEMASGSIRISNPEVQERVMKIVGMSKEEANEKFGFLLEAYKYAGPVHGGMGLGIARFLTLIQGYDDLREVIAFPKNKGFECPMDGSPSEISQAQLKELNLKVDVIKKK